MDSPVWYLFIYGLPQKGGTFQTYFICILAIFSIHKKSTKIKKVTPLLANFFYGLYSLSFLSTHFGSLDFFLPPDLHFYNLALLKKKLLCVLTCPHTDLCSSSIHWLHLNLILQIQYSSDMFLIQCEVHSMYITATFHVVSAYSTCMTYGWLLEHCRQCISVHSAYSWGDQGWSTSARRMAESLTPQAVYACSWWDMGWYTSARCTTECVNTAGCVQVFTADGTRGGLPLLDIRLNVLTPQAVYKCLQCLQLRGLVVVQLR